MHTFQVSTDSIGFSGNSQDFIDVWGFLREMPNFKGVEMIGWRNSLKLVKQLKSDGIETIGFHGPTGGFAEGKNIISKCTLAGINLLFDPLHTILSLPQEYTLLHVGCAKTQLSRNNILQLQNKRILIENDLFANSVEETTRTIQVFREYQIDAHMTFDIVHFLRSRKDKSFSSNWIDGLTLIESLKPKGLHIPIGTYESDSLPVSKLPLSAWRMFGEAINSYQPEYIVLENQQPRIYAFKTNKSERIRQRTRNQKIVELLTLSGIL